MYNEYIAMTFSILGMLVNIVSFQVKNKKPLLVLQTVGNILFLISFIFNSSPIAVILNVIYVVRNFVYLRFEGKTGTPVYISAAVLCAVFLASYTVYTLMASHSLSEDLLNFVPVAASIFGTVATACTDVNKYRMWKYGDSFCWLLFNARVGLGAIGGILGEVLNQVSLTVGIIRYRRKSGESQEKSNIKREDA